MSIIHELNKKAAEIEKQIKTIQSECSHPKSSLKVEHKSNTGNYDPSVDSWWTEYYCGLCEKSWHEDQK